MSALTQSAHALLADIHDVLGHDHEVQSRLGDPVRVYDAAPPEPVYPYVTYGAIRSEDRSGDAAPRTVHQITLHLYSRYEGRAETLETLSVVQRAIETGLSHTVLPLYADVFDAAEGGRLTPRTRHGLLRLSIITET